MLIRLQCNELWRAGVDSDYKTSDDIFQCVMCGDCCKGFGGTYVTDEDIEKIANFIQSDPIEFRAKFCDKSGSKYVLSQSETGRCIFFDDKKKCTIHPVKPRMCRNWPFIQTVVSHPENWDTMANSCPGMKKGVDYETLRCIVLEETNKNNSSTQS
ncbi:MAG: YkgJ family cysteine cluster protein [Desulfamplus sp.]|nr:YkgJ family cysteine cluster protein [Desulfamplus sp.]